MKRVPAAATVLARPGPALGLSRVIVPIVITSAAPIDAPIVIPGL
jgi:hypothetical protein